MLAKVIVGGVTEELIDFIMVEETAIAMLEKLSRKRAEGKKGWSHRHTVKNVDLLKMLQEHIHKGDMIDVINIAAMIRARNTLYGEDTILEEE